MALATEAKVALEDKLELQQKEASKALAAMKMELYVKLQKAAAKAAELSQMVAEERKKSSEIARIFTEKTKIWSEEKEYMEGNVCVLHAHRRVIVW